MPSTDLPTVSRTSRVKQDHNLAELGQATRMSKQATVQKRSGQALASNGSANSNSASSGLNSSSASKNVSHVPCKFFKQGMCQAGDKCPFSHIPVEGKNKAPCSYFLKGNCKFGAKCALAHITSDGRKVSKKQARLAQSAPQAVPSPAPVPASAHKTTSKPKDLKSKIAVPQTSLYTLAPAATTHSADVIFAPAVPGMNNSVSTAPELSIISKQSAHRPSTITSPSLTSRSLASPRSSFSSPRVDYASIGQPSPGNSVLHGSFSAFSSPAAQFQPLAVQSPASNARSLSFGFMTQRAEYAPSVPRASSFNHSSKERTSLSVQRPTNISQHISSLWNDPPSSVGLQMFAFEEGSAIIDDDDDDDDDDAELGSEESRVPSFLNDEPHLESTYASSYYRTDRSSISDSDFSPPKCAPVGLNLSSNSWQKNNGGLWAPRVAPPVQLPQYHRPHDSLSYPFGVRSFSATHARPMASDFSSEYNAGAENWNQLVHDPVRP